MGFGDGGYGLGPYGQGGTNTTTTTLAPGTVGAGAKTTGLKKMPAHAVEMDDQRSLQEHFKEFLDALKAKRGDIVDIERNSQRLFAAQQHQIVNEGGHLAANIKSDADIGSPTTLQDYLKEINTARGVYADLATAVASALGRTIIKRWNSSATYSAETISYLDYKSSPGNLTLDKVFSRQRELTPDIVPAMTTATNGVITIYSKLNSAEESTALGWQAFDDSKTTYFSIPNSSGTYSASGWLKVDFTTKKKVVWYKIDPHNGSTTANSQYYRYNYEDPTGWKLQGSNNNTTWIDLDVRTSISFSNQYNKDASQVFEVETPGEYRYYRINFTGSGPYGISISNVEFYELKLDSYGRTIDRTLFYPFTEVPKSSDKYEVTSDGRLRMKAYSDGTYPKQAVYLSPVMQVPRNRFGDGAIGRFVWNQIGVNNEVRFQVRSNKTASGNDNLALGKAVTANFTHIPFDYWPYSGSSGHNRTLQALTNGSTSNWEGVTYKFNGSYATTDDDESYVVVDLGIATFIDKIKVFHWYYGWPWVNYNWEVFYDSVLEVSVDGNTWESIFATGDPVTSSNAYAETSAGKTHLLNNKKVRYIRDKIKGKVNKYNGQYSSSEYGTARDHTWLEIQVFSPEFQNIEWDQIQNGEDLINHQSHAGNDWFQYRILLEATKPVLRAYSEPITLNTQSVLNINSTTLRLTNSATSGTWTSIPYVIDKDDVRVTKILTEQTGSIIWKFRNGVQTSTGILWKDWQLLPENGVVTAFTDTGKNIVQLEAEFQRLTTADPSPAMISAEVYYSATVYTVSPTVSNVRMNNYIKTYANTGEIKILLDTASTGTKFKKVIWGQELKEGSGISVQARCSDTYPFEDQLQFLENIPSSGSPVQQQGRYLDLRLILSSDEGIATSMLKPFELHYELDKNFESSRNLEEILEDLIKTNFELKRKTLFNQNGLYRIITDVFEDISGLGPESINVSYNKTNKYISCFPGLLEALIVTEDIPIAGTIDHLMGTISADFGNNGLVRMEYSLNGGLTWNLLPSYDSKVLLANPVQNPIIKIRVSVLGTAKLYGWAFAY